MKIAAGIIVFNGDYFLKQLLENIYPHFSQILIAEGPVKYWQSMGYVTSTDQTNDILNNFPDPDKKIVIKHGCYSEKTEQANAYMQYLNNDIDYIWNIDCDEFFKNEDIEKIKNILATEKPTSVGFKSITFYGGFDHYLTGFEQNHEFLRIQKTTPGCKWLNHRPPTITPMPHEKKHISFNTLAQMGIYMYHYSYVMPRQVYEKINYYENAVIQQNQCIPNYFNEVYMPWVTGDDKNKIEEKYQGVHEFVPQYRGDCYTMPFLDKHPEIIINNKEHFAEKFIQQLKFFKKII